jgi:hypothetical protein
VIVTITVCPILSPEIVNENKPSGKLSPVGGAGETLLTAEAARLVNAPRLLAKEPVDTLVGQGDSFTTVPVNVPVTKAPHFSTKIPLLTRPPVLKSSELTFTKVPPASILMDKHASTSGALFTMFPDTSTSPHVTSAIAADV